MIWTGERLKEKFTYIKCEWPSLAETQTTYGNVTSGQIDRSFFSTTKESCSFSFMGGDLPDTTNAVRIYYDFTDESGESIHEALGTFLVDYTDVDYINMNGTTIASGSVSGSSVLTVLSDSITGVAYSFEEGTETVATAAQIARDFGLKVQADESNHTLTGIHVFEPDDNWLTIVNWLLAQAGFAGCDTDAYGTVLMRKESNATGSTFDFTTGRNSVIYPKITESNDYLESANVTRCYYEDETCAVFAYAALTDGSPNALKNRGFREKTMYEQVNTLDGETATDKLAELKDYAKRLLVNNSNEIVKVNWRHPYLPIRCGHAVTVKYGKTYRLTVTNMSIKLQPATETQTQGRMIVRNDLIVEIGGDILWETSTN